MKWLKPSSILSIAACLVLASEVSFASANTVYISQNGGTFSGGSACNGQATQTPAFFNTPSNWTTGTPTGTKIGPGTTVYLCGTFTAAAGTSGYLAFQGGGASGNPITLQFDSGAIVQAPYWGTYGAIYANGSNYIVVNGGSNGVIQATACGTKLANCQTSTDPQMSGISFLNSSDSTIENVTISNIYVHSTAAVSGSCASSGTDECGQNSYGIYWEGGSNSQIENNTIHDAKWCVYFGYPRSATTSNDTIGPNNTVYNCDHDAVFGDGNSNAVGENLTINGNTFHDWANWDDAENNNHHDGIHVWAVHSGSTMSGVMIYNNYIYGNIGVNATAWIFDDDESGGVDKTPHIFNNLLVDTGTTSHEGCGIICTEGTNPIVLNNTVIGASTSWGIGLNFYGTGVTFENNVIENIETAVAIVSGSTITEGDYNDYYDFSSGGGGNGFDFHGSTWTGILSTWQSVCGCDSQSITSNPDLSSSFVPDSGSPLIEYGADLTSLGITALDSDKAGVLRPTGTCTTLGFSSCWTIGAYQLAGATALNPPTDLSAAVN